MQVTPELLGWLESQRAAGFGDEALLKSLLDVGYERSFAQDFLAGRHAKQASAPEQMPSPVSAQTASQTPVFEGGFFEAVPPAQTAVAGLFNTDNVRRAHDIDVRIVTQMAHPRLVVFDGLLSDAECDQLVELARPRLNQSLTVDRDSGASVQHQARVSSGMFFQRAENPLITLLEKRMSALLGFPEVNGEGLQILNYKPGGKYDPHQDYFDPAEPGSHVHLARGGQRIATLILYLNTPEAGGGTFFPDVGVTVSAVRGHAVFFSYPVAHASARCLHGGNPVMRGEKWIATKWIRESTFV